MNVETIKGFDIPKRELTEEEKTRDLTVNRIREFHYSAGEDFLDYADTCNVDVFAGYMMGLYPKRSKEFIEIINSKYKEVQDFKDIEGFGYDENIDMDCIYVHYVDFINLTEANKERDNQVLIQVVEYYNP